MHRPYSVAVLVEVADPKTREVGIMRRVVTVSARNEDNAVRLVEKRVKGCRPFDSWKGGPNVLS